ncbi:MAG: M20/M25/M40 family metallo-hydrolase [Thermoanaerobaculia bacterium]
MQTRTTRKILAVAATTATLCWLSPAPTIAEPTTIGELVETVRSYRLGHETAILEELSRLLEIPNVAADTKNIRRNAEHLVGMLERRGIEARILEVEGGSPAVFGHLRVPGAERTVVLYAHYDGQPVEPDAWASPPWTPTLRDKPLADGGREVPATGPLDGEWRLYARSASDDKGPIVAMLAAVDALAAAGVAPSVDVKFFFEGEEEAGSPHLAELLRRNQELLTADLWLFCDGPVHQSRRPQVVFGVRGVVSLEITFYGAVRTLHSGHYGNWAPNPIAGLVELLGGLRNADGQILVPGFYQDLQTVSRFERAALRSLPEIEPRLIAELGLAYTEGTETRLAQRIMLPALNFRGIRSGAVGAEAKNAIPTEATASIDFRLVPNQTPERVRTLVEAHLKNQRYHLVEDAPDIDTRRRHARIVRLEWGHGYPAARTPLELPLSQSVLRISSEATGGKMLAVPTFGGSLPLYLFEEILETPLIVVPIVNHDNNQHAPDENLRLQNLWDGIEIYASLLAWLGRAE